MKTPKQVIFVYDDGSVETHDPKSAASELREKLSDKYEKSKVFRKTFLSNFHDKHFSYKEFGSGAKQRALFLYIFVNKYFDELKTSTRKLNYNSMVKLIGRIRIESVKEVSYFYGVSNGVVRDKFARDFGFLARELDEALLAMISCEEPQDSEIFKKTLENTNGDDILALSNALEEIRLIIINKHNQGKKKRLVAVN